MNRSIARQNERIDDVALEPLEQHWRSLFARYDLNGDGSININEFIQRLKNDTNNDVPPRVIEQIRQSVAYKGKQFITYNDFIELITNKQPKNAFQKVFLQYIRHTIPPRKKKSVDATDGEYEDEYTCSPPAICMLIVSIIEISLFLYDAVTLNNDKNSVPISTFLLYNPHRRAEIWRYFTYMFVHIGNLHLIVNIIVQILLGVPLEMVHGWWRVLIVYLSGVLAGSLGTSVSDPNVYLAGASGGVYSLITAHVATIIMNWSEMQFAVWQMIIFLLLAVLDVGDAIYNRYMSVDTKIGYAAHLAGALSGLLVGLYILRNLEVHSWEKNVSRLAVILFLLLLIGCIIFSILDPDYFPEQDK